MLILKWRRFFLFLGDIALFFLALLVGLMLRRFSVISPEFYFANSKMFALLIPVWAGVFYVVGLYDMRRINRLVNLINYTFIAFVGSFAFSTLVLYMFYLRLGTPKVTLVAVLAIMHLFALVWRRLWGRYFLPKIFSQRVAFIGDNPLIGEICRDLEINPHLGFTVVPSPEMGIPASSGEYWKPTGKCCADLASKIDVLVVDADIVEGRKGVGGFLLSTAVMEEIPIFTHLDFYEDLYGKIPPEHAAKPSWLLSNVLHKSNQFYDIFKRVLDILGALIGLVITLPLTVGAYIAIKVEGGYEAPAFFVQKRVGHLGRRFIIWKFRTMVIGASKAGPLYKEERGDSRITKLGKFLRGTRLDEIPQLWNVLKGDMSLVGPRPEWTREVRILEDSVPHYHLRHLIKPGVTGWAQINFRATSSKTESVEKLHYDLYYVKNMSFALDLGIILRTFRRVLQKDSAMSGSMARTS